MAKDESEAALREFAGMGETRVGLLRDLLVADGGPEVFTIASEVMGTRLEAAEWLTTTWLGLHGKLPAKVALTAEGLEDVLNYLRQIEFGVHI